MTPPPGHRSLHASTWYDTPEWQGAWAETTIEDIRHRGQVEAYVDEHPHTSCHYLVVDSPFWSGYESDARVKPVFNGPFVTLPSLYSVFGPSHLAASESAVASVVDGALRDARGWMADALLVANLTTQAADQWAQFRPPCVRVRLDIAYFADVVGGIDAVLQSLPRRKRIDWRRRWRRATERGVRLVELPDTQASPWLAEVARLSNASAIKHGIAALYDLASLQRLAALPQARVFVAEHKGSALAAFLAFDHHDVIHLWAGGIDYTQLAEFSPYLFLLYELITMAPAQGWRRMEFGRGNYEFKRRYGFRGAELWTLCYPVAPNSGPRLAERLNDMHDRLAQFMGISSEVSQ
jgi:CelD/BcsL family acetyltransferase involved in cellulose biosynthesis